MPALANGLIYLRFDKMYTGVAKAALFYAKIKHMESMDALIDALVQDGYLKSQPIIDAFKKIDRKDFISEDMKNRAYENVALPIGYKQTISQPLAVAFVLELLEIRPGEKVLEIGTGSGWKTALLAQLVGGQGKVYSVERVSELRDFARKNLLKYAFEETGVLTLIGGDGLYGYPEHAPYDKIIAAASAKEIPNFWKEQIKIGGRIVAPVGDNIVVIDKIGPNQFTAKSYFGFHFMPLIQPTHER
jgi:protein-L-isoaspartate(D-aspartate) O-methyltransferase